MIARRIFGGDPGQRSVHCLPHGPDARRGAVRMALNRTAHAEHDVGAEFADEPIDCSGVDAATDHRHRGLQVRPGKRQLLRRAQILQPADGVAAVGGDHQGQFERLRQLQVDQFGLHRGGRVVADQGVQQLRQGGPDVDRWKAMVA